MFRYSGIRRRRRSFNTYVGKKFCFKPFKVSCPFFMLIDANGKTVGAIIVFGEIRKAFSCIHDIAVNAQVVFAGFRRTLVRDGVCGTVYPAGTAFVTEGSNPGIYRMIDL